MHIKGTVAPGSLADGKLPSPLNKKIFATIRNDKGM